MLAGQLHQGAGGELTKGISVHGEGLAGRHGGVTAGRDSVAGVVEAGMDRGVGQNLLPDPGHVLSTLVAEGVVIAGSVHDQNDHMPGAGEQTRR